MAAQRRTYEDLVWQAANKYGVPPNLVQSVLLRESGGNPNALSNKGAVGLMQVLPSTARGYNVNAQQLYNPATNVDVGAHYLADLYHRYGNNPVGALVAYNAGPGRWNEVMSGKRPYSSLPSETQNYVNNILSGSSPSRNMLGLQGNYTPMPSEGQQYTRAMSAPSMASPNTPSQNSSINTGMMSFSPYNQVSMQPYNDDLDYLINAYSNRISSPI